MLNKVKKIPLKEIKNTSGNIIKYIVRCPHKGNTIKDLEKAKWYINDLIKRLKDEDELPPSACY